MKTKSLNKKLVFKKTTVARLNDVELQKAHGGAVAVGEDTDNIYCDTKLVGVCTCIGSCCTCFENTCPEFGCKDAVGFV